MLKQIFTSTRQYYQTRERLRSDSDPLHNRTSENVKKHDELIPLEETIETQSMKSMATTTTASELDTLSEGSLGSSEALNWDCIETEDVAKQDLPTIAESGNRLSQLNVPPADDLDNPVSVVEILYDI